MPRPGQAPKSARTSNRKFNNPLSRWLDERKAKQKNLEEQAVRMISNKIEDNALKLMDELGSVDFIHSGLPESVLTNYAEGPYAICQLEWDTRALIQMIRNARQNINMDIRSIDEKLMTLVLMFKQFVAHGDVMASQMALDALKVGIQDIRCKLPVYQPSLAEAFVKENTEYLAKWVTLVGFAQRYDHTKNNLATERAATEAAEAKKEAKTEKVANRIESEPEFGDAFRHILEFDTPADRANWTKIQREVHTTLVDAKLEDFNIKLHKLQSITFENDLSAAKQQMESLRTCLNRLPNVSDPNLMNQYKEAMERFVHDIAESDARMEETLNTVDQLSGALDQLNESAGAVLMNEAAQQAAAKLLASYQKKVDQEIGVDAIAHARNLRELGWLTKEEREAQRLANEKRLAELKAQQAAEQQAQKTQNTNSQKARQAN